MSIKEQLASALRRVTDADGRSLAEIARSLKMPRQRLHQLRTADKVASSEAIAEALDALGYEVVVDVRPKR